MTISILLLAFSLACDSFAVAISCGVNSNSKITWKNILKTGLFFGIFQGIMPIIGFFIGKSIFSFLLNINHYIALIILSILGCKMIYEALKNNNSENNENNIAKTIIFSNKNLTILGIATSLDALAVGFSLIGTLKGIYLEAFIIGLVSFLLGAIGVLIGKTIGHFFENKFEIIGGLILIGIGIKIFIEH